MNWGLRAEAWHCRKGWWRAGSDSGEGKLHFDASQGCVWGCACTFIYGSTGLIEWYVEDGCAAVCRAIKAGLASGSGPLKLDSGRTFLFSWSSPDMHTQYRPALVHKLSRACYVLALFWPWRFSSEHTDKPCAELVSRTSVFVYYLSCPQNGWSLRAGTSVNWPHPKW